MLIGYVRVLMQDQNLESQREALTKAGRQKVFEYKVSCTRTDEMQIELFLKSGRYT